MSEALPISRPASLEQLTALNDEISALIKAGVPLELGLREFGGDEQGTLGDISQSLAARMESGESLAAAVAAEGNRLPPVYRVIVESGLRAGRLPAALEALSSYAWELIEVRRRVGLALLYPLIVLGLAYGLFLVFVLEMASRVRSAYETFRLADDWFLDALAQVQAIAEVWWWVPLAIPAAFFLWWLWTARRKPANLNSLIVGNSYRYAMFAEMLALQIEHEVPLHEGLVLAADATGTPAMREEARDLAEQIEQGRPPDDRSVTGAAIPPFLAWLLTRLEQQTRPVSALRMTAQMYRRRAERRTSLFKVVFPMAAAVIVGGGTVLCYTLMVFLPFIRFLNRMGFSDHNPLN